MSEKDTKISDDMIEAFCQSVSDLTNIIIDSAKPMEDIMSNLKEKFYEIVLPVITENMENIIVNINNNTIKTEKTEE